MNEKIKFFFSGLFSGFVFIGSIICAILFRKNKHRIDTITRTGIEQTRNTCESTKGTIKDLERTTESTVRIEQDLERTTEQLTNSVEYSKRILQELKKRQSEE